MSEPAVDAVVFDIGGVLLDWNPRHLYEQVIADRDELDHFLTVVCPHSWHLQHDRGVPFTDTIPVRQREFPAHAELIGLWSTRYPEMISGEVPGTATVASELRSLGFGLFALTNLPAEVWPPLRERWSVMGLFDGVLVSGAEGVIKPERAIYDLLVERFDLVRDRTVFVDDVEANVDGARAAGLRAIHFSDAEQLRGDLRALGIGLPA